MIHKVVARQLSMVQGLETRLLQALAYRDADIFISFQPVSNTENDFDGVVHNLKEKGFSAMKLRQKQLAKVHVRHMAVGRARVSNEPLSSIRLS